MMWLIWVQLKFHPNLLSMIQFQNNVLRKEIKGKINPLLQMCFDYFSFDTLLSVFGTIQELVKT